MPPDLLLEAASISKHFAGVHALREVSFDLRRGEVHALAGENGAGKSTLIKVITGAVRPDAGTISLEGRIVEYNDPRLARALGIAAIYQQPALFPQLTVAENIAIALETAGSWRVISWKERNTRASLLLGRAGSCLDPERLASSLSMAEQQIVEIAKAIGAEAKVVIMDEPTASLTSRETEKLFAVIEQLRARGAGVVYISHRLEEIAAVADRITVLRDGRTVGTRDAKSAAREDVIAMMAGRAIESLYPDRGERNFGETILELRNFGGVSLNVRAGEILGVSGLAGSGRTRLARSIFGLTPAGSGETLVGGQRAIVQSPLDAIRLGIGYVPEDRRQHGVVLELPIAANISLANLGRVSDHGLINRAREDNLARDYVERLHVRTPGVSAAAGTLSGGNQQKVALARWLAVNPRVLILDEPTQGIDVGSKAEIHALIADMAARGLATILISSELPEILGMSDRILVMRAGRIAAEFSRAEATQEKLLAAALGERAA